MRIALDGMGGDRGAAVLVEGAAKALGQLPGDVGVILVGDPEVLEPIVSRLGVSGERCAVHPASQVVGMGEAPGVVLRRKRDSSIRVAFDLHKAGEADAVISAGNSGATMAVGMVVMGRLPEVDRPGLASVFPGLDTPTVVMDVGANMDCSPFMLLQFGYMGSVYAERVLGVKEPKVGLLSIGEESGKGNLVVKQAYEYMTNSALRFAGNVEGRDLFTCECDVVVCDGFVGNVSLKLAEGIAATLKEIIYNEVRASFIGRVGGLLMGRAFKSVGRRMDYAQYGGAPLLGINGVCYVCHGASSSRAIASAINMAAGAVRGEVTRHLAEGLSEYRGTLLGEGIPA